MTLYGIDVAKYQGHMSGTEIAAEGFAWIEARASSGYDGGTVDPDFAWWKQQRSVDRLPLVAYHFLYGSKKVPIATQADTCARAIGDTSIPVMIDHETADGTGIPTIADALAFAAAMGERGYNVPLWYLPHWVWLQLGSPALHTSMAIVASAYVTGTGYASALYPGVAHWPAAYGGKTPVIWQFTDKATVAGQSVDADAFEGTTDQLKALLVGGSSMQVDSLTDAALTQIAHKLLWWPTRDGNGKSYPLYDFFVGANDRALKNEQTIASLTSAVARLGTQMSALQAAIASQLTALQAAVAKIPDPAAADAKAIIAELARVLAAGEAK